ncbi:MAG: TonB family protein [Cocleimonas sp.]
MFKIIAPTPKPIEKKAVPKLSSVIAPLPVEPARNTKIEKPIPIKPPIPPVIGQLPKPEPKRVKVNQAKSKIEKVETIKPKSRTIKPRKHVTKKKPKKRITKKKVEPKIIPQKKPLPKRRVIAKKKMTPKPQPAHKKVTQYINRKQRQAQQALALQKHRQLLAQQRRQTKKTTQTSPKPKKQASYKKIPRLKTIGNSHLEDQYGKSIHQRIKQKKVYPRRAKRMRKEGIVNVGFTISKNGTISKLRIIKSSGVLSLDKGALKTIKKIGRFPIFPAGLNKTFIDYIIPISYHRLK